MVSRALIGALALGAAVTAVTALSAAPDSRPPRIVAATMQDADGDARADRLRITYSERVRHRADRDGRYPLQVSGYQIASVQRASGKTVVVRLVEHEAADDGVRPSIRYRRTTSGPVVDRAGNQAANQVFRGVRPHQGAAGTPLPPPLPPAPPPDPALPPDTDPDRDGYVAPVDCAADNPAIHPGADDLPDLAFVDSNCDGIDGDERHAIFVSPLGSDSNPGTKAAPKRQIFAAVNAAPAGTDVLAAAGSYQRIGAKSGVDVYGGYDARTWTRSLTQVTEISGGSEAALAVGDTNVTLQLLTIRGLSLGQPGGSAYGIRAISGSSLTLQRVTVRAGNGSPGADGTPGADGQRGGRGGNGMRGDCDMLVAALGGVGGFSPAGQPGGRGGSGVYEGNGKSGESGGAGGTGAMGGPGGAASFGSAGRGQDGADGEDGANGLPGQPGAGGSDSTALAGLAWRGVTGSPGTAGSPGIGGGGGGAGGGQTGWFRINGTGNAGGGGGGGGGGGQGGLGGGYGGGSFGVYVHDSTVTVSDGSSIAAGNGGAGGRGGAGGYPGPGGGGGRGATECTGEVGAGGDGGYGGRGGPGGRGGGGAGGPSLGIFSTGTSSVTVTASTVTAGSPGAGGIGGLPGKPGIAAAVYPAE